MLRALGFGAVRSLPSAAALNWVLKDGLGRLGRLICAAYFGHIFDSDLKKVRILTSLLYSMSLGLETLTPFFPQVFLLLATLANIGKSMSLAAYVATTSTIHKSFALGDNLAEISAKSQAQAVAADNVGLAMSICISLLCKHDPRLPLCLFPFLCTTELALIYKELQYVHFQTLNKVRLEIIIDRWVANGTIPSFEEVSKDEGLSLLGLSGNRQWPLRIGPPNVKLQKLEDLTDLLQQGEDQRYFLHFEHSSRLASKSLKDVPIGLYLWLRKDFSSSDIIMGTLQANYLRQMACEPNRDVRSESGNEAAACNPSKSRWSSLQEKSKLLATMNVQQLLRNMEMSGWATNYILLNHTERGTYNMNT